jgi:hypothetical protein
MIINFIKGGMKMQQLYLEDKNPDEVEYVTAKKSSSFGDIIMLQTIFCILIILALAVMNIFSAQTVGEALSFLKEQLDAPFEFADEIEKLFLKVRGLI